MASDAEPAKLLLPYLQRADELQKHEPLVAYYCRLYAMDRGLRIPANERTKTTSNLLISLMNQLEKDKKTLKLASDDNLYLEGFASNVFAKADKQDRSGRADLNTAKTFYAASIFFEILNQFGELQPDLEQKQKYAVWKAADIRKAIKEGRRPEPGPPGGEKDLSIPSDSPASSIDIGRSQSFSAGQQGSSDTPPPQSMDKSYLEKDLERRMSFSSTYTPAPTDPTPPTHHTPPHQQPPQHSSTPTLYTPPPYTTSSSYSPPTDAPQYPPPPPDPASYNQHYHQDAHYTQNSYPTDNPSTSFSYPNFQSYPSFQDSTLPSVPTHQPAFYSDPNQFQNVFASSAGSTPVTAPPARETSVAPVVPVAENYHYDSSYQPSVEKIAEAHKAARFAVGALAFDDVVVAVDHLKRALDLLTNPSAKMNN
ncbi:Vacuolar protein sorting-associated protein VTA1 [Rhynchospora pubera]|uniref:Vacuolar protein sorting-associated protein VTA1 n=1 Tax=Rhynchospora pubera TaxID=906938 RepID=A0AAV8FK33_9POAL|nr:Vacuolar protein sorting-associated protein VTA1 [Rhynchospora pubera]KAJ4793864.1 Vacuolar protein sorting-associated protein VTA1 [Rhynchospora pubera]KAJ4793867.1 Vacuolar protein sorting-associated protein VTA1 [Rhynchospora pubera]